MTKKLKAVGFALLQCEDASRNRNMKGRVGGWVGGRGGGGDSGYLPLDDSNASGTKTHMVPGASCGLLQYLDMPSGTLPRCSILLKTKFHLAP